jgi:hypothetical protein
MRHSCLRLCARGCEYAMTRSLIGVYYLIMLSWLSAYKFYAWDRPEVTMRLLALIPGGALHTHALKAAFVVGCAIFAACVHSDPGVVTTANQPQLSAHYPSAMVALATTATGAAPKYCGSCQFLRPPRTHHCRECDRCVFKFDHHCGWLNNCVGYKNLRLFVLLLGFHAALCGYGLLVVSALIVTVWRTVKNSQCERPRRAACQPVARQRHHALTLAARTRQPTTRRLS